MLQVEEVERAVALSQQGAIIARANGAKVDVPDMAAVRRQFDAWLMEDPRDEDPSKMIKMRALGVSKGR